MTPDTVADGAETRVGEVNERQGDLWERAGRGEKRMVVARVRTRFGAEKGREMVGVEGKGRGAQQPVLDDHSATTTSPMLQWIPSKDVFVRRPPCPVQSSFLPIILSLSFHLFPFLPLFLFPFFFLFPSP